MPQRTAPSPRNPRRGAAILAKLMSRARLSRHENKKVPIKRPAANAQSPKVHAEIRRKRLRKSVSCKSVSCKSVSCMSCSRWVMQRPPAAAASRPREIWTSRQRQAEQVPPDRGPKKGNLHHAKSRIAPKRVNGPAPHVKMSRMAKPRACKSRRQGLSQETSNEVCGSLNLTRRRPRRPAPAPDRPRSQTSSE